MNRSSFTWNNIKKKVRPYLTPKMFISYSIAWLITNGWCYIFIALGPILRWSWMTWLGGVWAAVLWFPLTVEKPFTLAIAVWIQNKLFIKNKKATD